MFTFITTRAIIGQFLHTIERVFQESTGRTDARVQDRDIIADRASRRVWRCLPAGHRRGDREEGSAGPLCVRVRHESRHTDIEIRGVADYTKIHPGDNFRCSVCFSRCPPPERDALGAKPRCGLTHDRCDPGQAVEHGVILGADRTVPVGLHGPLRTKLRQATGCCCQIARVRGLRHADPRVGRLYTLAIGPPKFSGRPAGSSDPRGRQHGHFVGGPHVRRANGEAPGTSMGGLHPDGQRRRGAGVTREGEHEGGAVSGAAGDLDR